MTLHQPPSALPGTLQSRYRIGRTLGAGGMSTVYAAHDRLLDRDVAVKVFTADASRSGDLQAQQAEAHLLAALNHYALTTLLDAGVDSSDPARPRVYLVMEYIPGDDLRERLRQGPLTALQASWLGFDLADALAYVHESGFVHHDIKPANVLIAHRGADTRIRGKLTDFGIATLVGQPDTSEYTTGTAAYLSPELVDGEDATPASDIYSLGLVLLEAVTGQVAYPGSVTESALARLDRQPAVPADLPAPLAALLTAMTARHPAARPDAAAVAAAFRSLVVDQVVPQRPADLHLTAQQEAERAAVLRSYNILDTPPDDAFDTVTRLAAQVLQVPIAIVTLIDTDRVWFKSKHGIELIEVTRDSAFCSTTNPGRDGAWTIPDALADDRTRFNPLVTGDPNVRSYAAAPLVTHDGHHLGALCVFDRHPRQFQPEDLENLADLASVIMRELELRRASRRALFARD